MTIIFEGRVLLFPYRRAPREPMMTGNEVGAQTAPSEPGLNPQTASATNSAAELVEIPRNATEIVVSLARAMKIASSPRLLCWLGPFFRSIVDEEEVPLCEEYHRFK